MDNSIENLLSNYSVQQLKKIKDFLLSEIDDDNLQETIDFVESSDLVKKEKYKDILYTGDKYSGLSIEGNQYLIYSNQREVTIIDMVSEENGVNGEQARINIAIKEFVQLLNSKKEIVNRDI